MIHLTYRDSMRTVCGELAPLLGQRTEAWDETTCYPCKERAWKMWWV